MGITARHSRQFGFCSSKSILASYYTIMILSTFSLGVACKSRIIIRIQPPRKMINMKHTISLLLGILLASQLFAQEALTSVKYNVAYEQIRLNQLQEKTLEGPTGLFFTVSGLQNATCQSEDGSIVITPVNGTPPYSINVLGAGFTESFPVVLSNEDFAISNLPAGGYSITITELTDQTKTYTDLVLVDNKSTDPVPSGNIVLTDAGCNGIGCMQMVASPTTQQQSFAVFNSNHEQIGSLLDNGLNTVCEEVGIYYVRRTSPDSCNSYYELEIIPELIAPIPFIEDFTTSSGEPDFALWADRSAYVNTGFPKNPPSMGVATFDGLNDEGLPYENVPFFNGFADKLTTRPFCLASFVPSDSLYLSFFYQAEGNGDYPNPVDSLMLELLDDEDNWNLVWAVPGRQGNGDFEQVIIPVKEQKYFHDGFKFRFLNKATISGLNDHWHVDLIRFDADRTFDDLFFNDVSFAYPPKGLLSNYSSMPWNQFQGHQEKELNTNMEFYIKTYDDDILGVSTFMETATSLVNTCEEFATDSLGQYIFVDTGEVETWNIYPTVAGAVDSLITRQDSVPAFEDTCGVDVVVRTSYSLDINDTVKVYNQDQVFSNYFAYDDGEAERGYALYGGNAMLAHRFVLNEPDYIRGLSVNFVQVVQDFSTLPFSLAVWKRIDNDNSGEDDDLLYQSESELAKFSGVVNGFATYRFDLPPGDEIMVEDTFYVGFIQDEAQEIIVGYDRNTARNEQVWYNTSGEWFSSIFPGALMLRPLMGCELDFPVANETSTEIEDAAGLQVFPNPSSGLIRFETGIQAQQYHVEVLDLYGRLVYVDKSNDKNLDLVNISPGMYILRVRTEAGDMLGTQKFIKN